MGEELKVPFRGPSSIPNSDLGHLAILNTLLFVMPAKAGTQICGLSRGGGALVSRFRGNDNERAQNDSNPCQHALHPVNLALRHVREFLCGWSIIAYYWYEVEMV
jgi:hypothetical protein